MRSSSSHVYTVPMLSGKAWVQPMESTWNFLCTTYDSFTQPFMQTRHMVINRVVLPSSYTNCTHLLTRVVGKFTPVISRLSAVYTGPITTTTTYISI